LLLPPEAAQGGTVAGYSMPAPLFNPLNVADHPGSSENGDLVFCERSTSPLVVSKALMEAICNQINDGVWALPRGGGAEVAGLLVGAKSGGNPAVEQVVPISTEQRFGPAFHLSPTDVEGIEQAIASAHRDQTHTVIGFYRSRTRVSALSSLQEGPPRWACCPSTRFVHRNPR
jgi:hypothetical protein